MTPTTTTPTTPTSSRSDKMRHIKERLNLICKIQLQLVHTNSNPNISAKQKRQIAKINDDLVNLKILMLPDDDGPSSSKHEESNILTRDAINTIINQKRSNMIHYGHSAINSPIIINTVKCQKCHLFMSYKNDNYIENMPGDRVSNRLLKLVTDYTYLERCTSSPSSSLSHVALHEMKLISILCNGKLITR